MSAGIFISYRRQDSIAHARAVYERLRAEFGLDNVFIDLEGLDIGDDFVESLERQLAHCRVVVALIGPQWLDARDSRGRRRLDSANDFVRIELCAALVRKGVRVVPVLIDGTALPTEDELPPDLHPLLRRQALTLRFDNFDSDIRRLVAGLQRMLVAQSPTAPDAKPAEPAPAAPHEPAAGPPPVDPVAPPPATASPPASPLRAAGAMGSALSSSSKRALLIGGGAAGVLGGAWAIFGHKATDAPPTAAAPAPAAPASAPAAAQASATRPNWASADGLDKFGRFAEFTIGPVVQRLRWIEPGQFLMGSPDGEPERSSDEGPQHGVRLSRGLWLADTACTQALWLAVLGGPNPADFKSDPNRPVEQVSHDEALTFLARLRERLAGAADPALPTEAQWEYACRAGTTTPFSFGTTITPDQANYDGNIPYNGGPKGLSRGRTVAVKSLPPNRWGLFEMHGNVYEWCADGGLRSYQAVPTGQLIEDPFQPPEQGPEAHRAVRGGSWVGHAAYLRAAFRLRFRRGSRVRGLGFRVALRS